MLQPLVLVTVLWRQKWKLSRSVHFEINLTFSGKMRSWSELCGWPMQQYFSAMQSWWYSAVACMSFYLSVWPRRSYMPSHSTWLHFFIKNNFVSFWSPFFICALSCRVSHLDDYNSRSNLLWHSYYYWAFRSIVVIKIFIPYMRFPVISPV